MNFLYSYNILFSQKGKMMTQHTVADVPLLLNMNPVAPSSQWAHLHPEQAYSYTTLLRCKLYLTWKRGTRWTKDLMSRGLLF